jgi:hypothetical protein
MRDNDACAAADERERGHRKHSLLVVRESSDAYRILVPKRATDLAAMQMSQSLRHRTALHAVPRVEPVPMPPSPELADEGDDFPSAPGLIATIGAGIGGAMLLWALLVLFLGPTL